LKKNTWISVGVCFVLFLKPESIFDRKFAYLISGLETVQNLKCFLFSWNHNISLF